MCRVVNVGCIRAGDREAEAPERRFLADRLQAVHLVRRNIDQVSLADFLNFLPDYHLPLTVEDIVELVGRVSMRIYRAATNYLEFVYEFQRSASSLSAHGARRHEIPDRGSAIVLGSRLY